jgi:hypothetical protein
VAEPKAVNAAGAGGFMAANEGVRRVKLLAKTLFFGGVGSAIILLSSMLLAQYMHLSSRLPVFLPLAFLLTVLGIVLWVVGWLLEGFFMRQ